MSSKSPLQVELDKLNSPEEYNIIPHINCEHLAIGIKIENRNEFFNLPIDITDSQHNIVDDEGYRFKVDQFSSQIDSSFRDFINTKICLLKAENSDTIYIENKEFTLRLFYRLDWKKDYMNFSVQYINETPEKVDTIIEGRLNSIIPIYKIFEKKSPITNQITMRTTAEVGVLFEINKNLLMIIKVELDYFDEANPLLIIDSDEIIDFAVNNGLKNNPRII
ncbi:hypothetical protein [Hanstruepera ponticola]|uniref:hypothetical protein n=1 Tax=Hanstruepera ponticola TaxID=2042995 RepID=UPI00177C3833|nr:hypothetical protein [Hanstruepera ponticola]